MVVQLVDTVTDFFTGNHPVCMCAHSVSTKFRKKRNEAKAKLRAAVWNARPCETLRRLVSFQQSRTWGCKVRGSLRCVNTEWFLPCLIKAWNFKCNDCNSNIFTKVKNPLLRGWAPSNSDLKEFILRCVIVVVFCGNEGREQPQFSCCPSRLPLVLCPFSTGVSTSWHLLTCSLHWPAVPSNPWAGHSSGEGLPPGYSSILQGNLSCDPCCVILVSLCPRADWRHQTVSGKIHFF